MYGVVNSSNTSVCYIQGAPIHLHLLQQRFCYLSQFKIKHFSSTVSGIELKSKPVEVI